MGAPRKHPPQGAAETIQRLASTGFAIIGIAKEFKVAKETLKRWLEDSETLQEAFDTGREIERQALHASVYRSAMEGKPANVNAFFLLKARHGYVEADQRSTNVNVGVTVAPSVMIVKDHGTDDQWAAKAAEQQRRLVLDSEASHSLPSPAPAATSVIPVASSHCEASAHSTPSPSHHAPPEWRGNA
jgi:hypothetical protein